MPIDPHFGIPLVAVYWLDCSTMKVSEILGRTSDASIRTVRILRGTLGSSAL
jgi:hypothetical protein